jgi:hypothetical protein
VLTSNEISVLALATVQLCAYFADAKKYKDARDILTSAQRFFQAILQANEDSPNYNTVCEEYVS